MVSTRFLQTVLTGLPFLLPLIQATPLKARDNNFSCRSSTHPNPVVLVHGLFANQYDDVFILDEYLANLGFCTFSLTYGEYPEFPAIGGLQPIATSAVEIADFIQSVQTGTGASKVDLVGHSEGGFQVLYVPKFESGISGIVDNIVAIAPPTHGATVSNLYNLTFIAGEASNEAAQAALNAVGCDACNDLTPNGDAVQMLNNGPIVQSGNVVTVIISTHDEIVTPPITAATVYESGVTNIVIQDQCPDDPAGHVGLVLDSYVFGLVANALDPTIPLNPCAIGPPL